MSARLPREAIHFCLPFARPETEDTFPVGHYWVAVEGEKMEGVSLTAWHIVRTMLCRIGVTKGLFLAVEIGSEVLTGTIAACFIVGPFQ